uniref:Uncharacterized protein LOC104215893 n=1 Tax=Nicotiana sylvestris TaxID=4096 RepID=A0A1U7VCL4_NICSY
MSKYDWCVSYIIMVECGASHGR